MRRALIVAVLGLAAPDASAAAPAPGIVLLTVDTLRADHLSPYGNRGLLTPHIERLARSGTLFRAAIAQATTTSPSHASLFTGLYPQDHNVYSNFEALGDASTTLAEVLRDHGFATFAMVNMRHLNPEVANLGQGFATVVPSGAMRRAAATVQRFLQWLDASPERPFFAWLHLVDVHTPYRPPPPYDRLYYDDDEHDPETTSLARIFPLLPTSMSAHPLFRAWLAGVTDLRWVTAQYRGAVSYVDSEVGALLQALAQRGRDATTAVVLTADHGESLGEHGMYFVHTGLYEPTVHVPLIMRLPGGPPPGREVRDVVELVDVLPTLLAHVGAKVPDGLRGRSLLPAMTGSLPPNRVAMSEHAGRNQLALRTSRFKYIRHLRTANLQPGYPFRAGREELYDLQEDPGELHDLSAVRPNVVRVFRAEAGRRRAQGRHLERGRARLDDETVEVLRALGYMR